MSKEQTPLMLQYNQIKSKNPDAILLFRMGDFYETFGEDAVLVAGILGITLTKRNNGAAEETELAGFPYHSLDLYLPRLVKAGHRVAICEQLEKPQPNQKIVRRGITEIVTPGLVTTDSLLESGSNNFLAALHFGVKNTFGIAFLDLSTGEFLVSEGDVMYIEKLLQSFKPSELIFTKSKKKEIERLFNEAPYPYGIDDWVFTDDYCRDKLLEQFETASLKGFGIEDLQLAQVAAGAILHYLNSTQNNQLRHLTHISRIHPDKYVWLDRFTIRNLELLSSQHEGGTPLIKVLDFTTTPMGARLLRKWVALPLKDLHAIENRLDIVRLFVDKSDLADALTFNIKQIGDLERLISKVPMAKINPREVQHLGRGLNALEPIIELLKQTELSNLISYAERINPCITLRERINKELTDNPPIKIEKGQTISSGVNQDLDELRHLVNHSQDVLLEIQNREAKNTGIDNLKIGFNNVFGYYFEVTNKHKDKGLIPPDWVRKQTLTGAERYINDELKKLETQILTAEEKIQKLEETLFHDLCFAINEYIKPIQLNATLVAQLDCLLSFARVAIKNNYCRPQVNDSLQLELIKARHPVIEQLIPIGDSYIPNDLQMDAEEQQILMITGPNMSGKSAILRQTALICLMAQMGSFVPAQTAKIGILDKVFSRVGASDNIAAGESTFMVEMNETAAILNNLSPRSLILLDEIGRGTSTYDGVSIAWAIAEFLHNHPTALAKTLFATHYHELNELAEHNPRIKNYHVATREVDNKIIFLRKLTEGGSQHSFGIHVARMAGMPKTLLERANEILKELEDARQNVGNTESNPKKAGISAHPKPASTPVQLSIFETAVSVDPRLEKLKSHLEDLDPNRMTPIDCMLQLIQLKNMLEENGS